MTDRILRCSVCKSRPLSLESERRATICERCADGTGISAQPPELRPNAPCRGCRHTQLVRAMVRERDKENLAPLAISFAPTAETEWHGGQTFTADPKRAIGVIVGYVCRACGLTELYTMAADQLPIGPEYGTALIDVGPVDGPFR